MASDESPKLMNPSGATERLRIEPLSADHADILAEVMLDPKVYGFFPDDLPADIDALRRQFHYAATGPHRPGSIEVWWNHALLCRETGHGVGRLEATLEGTRADLAYLLGSAWWGQGLATEALEWLSDTLIAHGMTELWATVTPGNVASQRVAEKLGFVVTTPPEKQLPSYDPGDIVLVKTV